MHVLDARCLTLRTYAGSIVIAGAGIFTNSAAVAAGMRSLAPLFSVVLIIHTTSMVTEGTMLAGAGLTPMRPRVPDSYASQRVRLQRQPRSSGEWTRGV